MRRVVFGKKLSAWSNWTILCRAISHTSRTPESRCALRKKKFGLNMIISLEVIRTHNIPKNVTAFCNWSTSKINSLILTKVSQHVTWKKAPRKRFCLIFNLPSCFCAFIYIDTYMCTYWYLVLLKMKRYCKYFQNTVCSSC